CCTCSPIIPKKPITGRREATRRLTTEGETSSATLAKSGRLARCASAGRFGEARMQARSAKMATAYFLISEKKTKRARELFQRFARPEVGNGLATRRDRPSMIAKSVAGVHCLDLFGKVLAYLIALHLERRRELAVLDGEVARKDRELLHLLDACVLLVELVEMRLDGSVDARILMRL